MAGIPRLKNFCCFLSLETGSLIIAWLYVISSILTLIVVSIYYPYAIDYLKEVIKPRKKETDLLVTDPTTKRQIEEGRESDAMFALGYIIAYLSLGVAVNIMLLLGIYRRNTCLMVMWIILFRLGCLLGFVCGLFNLVTSFYSFDAIMSAVLLCILIVCQIYVLLIIESFFDELNAQWKDSELFTSGSSFFMG